MNSVVRRLAILLLIGLTALPALAQSGIVELAGRLRDSEGRPISAARVVYIDDGTADVFLSELSEPGGEFTVVLPRGAMVRPTAVVLDRGRRIEFPMLNSVAAEDGIWQELTVPVAVRAEMAGPAELFPGSDRLFNAFVEDTRLTGWQRYEAQVDLNDGDPRQSLVSRAIASFQAPSIPQIEWGARVGLGGVELDSGVDGGGVTDTDIWAKLDLAVPDERYEFAVGAIATIPTGDPDEGTGFDSTRSKLFGAARFNLPRFVLATHLGVRFNGDGEVFGVPLDGQIAPEAGVSVLLPIRDRIVLVGEASYADEAFAGLDSDARVLAGVNWSLFDRGVLRFAVGTGFTDGAPDVQAIGGFAIEF